MDKTLRILMVAPQFRPIVGGYERAAERLAEGLANSGHSVEIVTERRSLSWPRKETSRGIVIRRTPVLFYKGAHSLTSIISLALFLLIRGRRYDVFHVHQYGWSAAVTSALGLIHGKPVFLKLTNTGYLGLDAVLPPGPIGNLLRWLHRRVSCCVVTSQRAFVEAQNFGFSEQRICTVPNPMETELFRPTTKDAREKLRVKLGLRGKFTALCAARLSDEKDHATLIRAWSTFSRGNSDAIELLILGDGPLEQKIQKQISDSAGSHSIRMLGRVSEPLPWYQAADVYVLSSKAEGLSNALIEALSCGLPIISTQVSGSEDIFQEVDVGQMVEVGDHAAISCALNALKNDPGRRTRYSATARKYAEEHYSLSAIVKEVEQCYEKHSRR